MFLYQLSSRYPPRMQDHCHPTLQMRTARREGLPPVRVELELEADIWSQGLCSCCNVWAWGMKNWPVVEHTKHKTERPQWIRSSDEAEGVREEPEEAGREAVEEEEKLFNTLIKDLCEPLLAVAGIANMSQKMTKSPVNFESWDNDKALHSMN